eukprot:TRINITY_DN15043_c0_g1_i1.p1 TRINITY_DN15043_c0_g1~~TRINITY_DN15043_c0_g1_i1.p1  ORF type:complete len:600 (-),score=91.22 TRINITY_DN15043_c0_g1_i1:265-2064(-)
MSLPRVRLFGVIICAFRLLGVSGISEKRLGRDAVEMRSSRTQKVPPKNPYSDISEMSPSDTSGEDVSRVYIRFAPGKKEDVRSALRLSNAKVHYAFDGQRAFAASVPSKALEALVRNPNIELVEDDPLRRPYGWSVSAAVANATRVNMSRAESIPYGLPMVQALDAHNAGVTGSGVRICIIDSGIDADHEDLQAVTSTANGYAQSWDSDGCSHGTHVAGTIAASKGNGLGVVGVSPNVSLFIVKVFGSNCGWSYSSTLLDAAQRCANANARIISMSLGGGGSSTTEESGFNALRQGGVLSIAAAGNGGNTATSYPAGYASVVSVAAVDSAMNVASFSQRNADVELAAPGVDVLSTVNGGAYAYYSGTSMATPHVSAVAALAWSSKPSASPDEILEALVQTAVDRGDPGRDSSYGHGIVQAADAIAYLNPSPCASAGDCDDSNPCTEDMCVESVCKHSAIVGCVPCSSPAQCDDGNICTTDQCLLETCQHEEDPNCEQPEIHVGALDARTARASRGEWTITITIEEAGGEAGVLVSGHFDPGNYVPEPCTTTADGSCSISARASNSLKEGTFTVDGMVKTGFVYKADQNIVTTVGFTKPR